MENDDLQPLIYAEANEDADVVLALPLLDWLGYRDDGPIGGIPGGLANVGGLCADRGRCDDWAVLRGEARESVTPSDSGSVSPT